MRRLSIRCRALWSASSSQRCAVPRCGTVQSASGRSSRSASQSAGGNGITTRRARDSDRDVVADQEGAQHRGVLLLLEPLEESVLAPHDPALPHADQHADRVVAVPGVADDVGVTRAHHLHARRLLQPLQPAERVAHVLGALVVLAAARGDHGLAHLLAHVAGAPVEEVHHVLDHPPVVLHALPAHARREAAADVVVQARPLAPLGGQVVGAAPDRVQPADDRERAPQLADVGVGAVVPGARDVAPAGDEHAGERVGQRHGDGGIALVVLEPDVEPGPVLLDEVVLEDQRLRLGGHDDGLDVGDQALEQLVLGAAVEVGREVAPHPALEPLGLADVQNLPVRVLPQVHAGAVGEGIELALERVGYAWCRHGVHCRRVNPPGRRGVPASGAVSSPPRPRVRRGGR